MDLKELHDQHKGLIETAIDTYLPRIPPGTTRDDVRHECLLGMYRATETYNKSKGAFTTYAMWWMRGYIRNFIRTTLGYPVSWLGKRKKISLHSIRKTNKNQEYEKPVEGLMVEDRRGDYKIRQIDVADYLKKATEGMKKEWLEILQLHYLEGITLEEIAFWLALKISRVKTLVYWGLSHCRFQLKLPGFRGLSTGDKNPNRKKVRKSKQEAHLNRVRTLVEQGFSTRRVAKRMGISKDYATKLVKLCRECVTA